MQKSGIRDDPAPSIAQAPHHAIVTTVASTNVPILPDGATRLRDLLTESRSLKLVADACAAGWTRRAIPPIRRSPSARGQILISWNDRTCSLPQRSPVRWMIGYFASAPSAASAQLKRLFQSARRMVYTRSMSIVAGGADGADGVVGLVFPCGRYPDRPRSQPPLAAEDNLNPEGAKRGLCPTQPTGECAGIFLANQTGPQPWDCRPPGCLPAKGRMRFPSIALCRP